MHANTAWTRDVTSHYLRFHQELHGKNSVSPDRVGAAPVQCSAVHREAPSSGPKSKWRRFTKHAALRSERRRRTRASTTAGSFTNMHPSGLGSGGDWPLRTRAERGERSPAACGPLVALCGSLNASWRREPQSVLPLPSTPCPNQCAVRAETSVVDEQARQLELLLADSCRIPSPLLRWFRPGLIVPSSGAEMNCKYVMLTGACY
ncbi:hypothetical protein EYF80_045953 [Liparis tanakae]|uniref:Uncharacterized protein n=1 Tax=Liparis tanakae TaxID=230148 RepID=A0A4Z2FRS7_9TELE|nr:hypothetical protein EYF80_045953 [Liparis tanakae]